MHFGLLHLATATANVLIGVGVLIVFTILGGLVILRVRRAMLADDVTETQGLLLSDLRAMRARGEISEEEFESLRTATLREHGLEGGGASQQAKAGFDLAGDPLPESDSRGDVCGEHDE